LNKIFCFDKIANSKAFDYLMLLIVLFNTGIRVKSIIMLVILIMYAFVNDQDTLDLLDAIDNYLVYVYATEACIKLLGLGITKYFNDGYNWVDFILTIISLATTIALSFTKFARTAKATRVLKNLRVDSSLTFLIFLGPESTQVYSCFQIL
jgi:hypothetical protein